MKKVAALLIVFIMIIVLVACDRQSDTASEIQPETESMPVENLAKLAKVWGFAKYTHPVFLSGKLCWDEELLNLIPIIYSADADDVNDILYSWFAGLGDDGFDGQQFVAAVTSDYVIAKVQLNMPSGFFHTFMHLANEGQLLEAYWHLLLGLYFLDNIVILHIQIDEAGLPYFEAYIEAMADEHVFIFDFDIEVNIDAAVDIRADNGTYYRQMADLSWINESYLGLPLYERLSRFHAIPSINRENAPVYFDNLNNSVFTNQQFHEHMDFSDMRYRLLGLFRLWNAMEYYFPYRDILDRCWHELLAEHIVVMLEGSDRLSYELALASLSMHLHDAHIAFANSTITGVADFYQDRFGSYFVPIWLTEAEGYLLVLESATALNGELLPGDIIKSINGAGINDVTADMLQFLSFPNEEKALAYFAFYWGLYSHYEIADIEVLRGDTTLSLQIETIDENIIFQRNPLPSSVLLESNIGLINPRYLSQDNEAHDIMRNFYDTDGLIIDLRQYPWHHVNWSLAALILTENEPFALISSPSISVPGKFADNLTLEYTGDFVFGFGELAEYSYNRPVVLLMNEQSLSASEWFVMSLRTGANVTVIGSNSIGANGNVTILPLPGNIVMTFTGLGIYTPEGGQTQRIGLSPDIRVDRTIQGITEGRDELMEAAVAFILESIENP